MVSGLSDAPHTKTWCCGDLYCRLSKNHAKRRTMDFKTRMAWRAATTRNPPMTKRTDRMQIDIRLAHLPRIGVKWNRKTKKRKRELSFFFMKREQEMRC